MNQSDDPATTLEDDLLDVLRAATKTPTLTYDGVPRRLTGGFWAELVAFRLQDAPDGWAGDLVARVMPDPVTAAKETAIQAEVAAQGFPTPSVHLAGGPDEGLGRAFMVMDLAEGGPLLGGLDGVGAVTSLPKLARRLPAALGEAMATLHRLDVSAVRARLATLDEVGSLSVTELLAHFREHAEVLGRADLAAAARWLQDHPPAPAPEVVCHGDLHPFNLLIATDGALTVLDWSASMLAPAAYDVAFTSLVLSEPPLAVPRAVQPLVRMAGRWLARRFRRVYAERVGRALDPVSLEWHEGVVCLRALSEVASWVAAGQADERAGHPWMVSAAAFADRLARLTGTRVSAR